MLNNNQNNMMMNNLSLRQLGDREVFQKFLAKPEHVTKDAAKGHLVKENVGQQFTSMLTDNFKDISNLGEAFVSGKSNDHALGRMNDLGMKLGGSIIAAALMGRKATTNKKLMEIFGFTTFFSTMSLWPKIAIDLPTKLRFGFNPHQKYVDSQGRKKQFFLDNQYLPWDVWSKEDINKVADKMKVPKDLKDREEYTKEKMRTIALQDNTLWMLTAGLASPLLTSLACNRIEAGLKTPVAKAELQQVEKNISNIADKTLSMSKDTNITGKSDEAFSAIYESLKKGEMPKNLEEQLSEIFDIRKGIQNEDLVNRLQDHGTGKKLYDILFKDTKSSLKFEDSDLLKFLKETDPENADEILGILNKAKGEVDPDKGLKGIVQHLEKQYSRKGQSIIGKGSKKAAANGGLINKKWVAALSDLSQNDKAQAKAYAKQMSVYNQEELAKKAGELSSLYENWLKPSQANMRFLEKNLSILNNVSGEKYNSVAKTFVKTLGFTDKEIKVLKASNEAAGGDIQQKLTEKLIEVAQDETKYNKAIKKLDKQIAKIDKQGEKGLTSKITDAFNSLVDKVKGGLTGTSKGANKELQSAFGDILTEGLSKNDAASLGADITSVNSTLIRFKAALELERDIQSGKLITECAEKMGLNAADITDVQKTDIIESLRRMCWQSSFGDAMNKGYKTGNGKAYSALIETIFPKAAEGAENGKSSWQKAVNELFLRETYIPNPSLSKEGDDIWNAYVGRAWGAFNEYNGNSENVKKITNFGQLPKEMLEQIQNEVTGGKASEYFKPSNVKFADYGESVLSAVKKQANQMYNDRTWMKVFGGATIALVGFTLISQLFFGKVKDAHLYQKKEDKDTFESGK